MVLMSRASLPRPFAGRCLSCGTPGTTFFEPVTIGPVVAKNRFFQVPHCNGMGYRDPSGEAYMGR